MDAWPRPGRIYWVDFSRQSHVNCAQLLTLDQRRLGEPVGDLGEERMSEVDEALRYELGL